MLFGSRVFGLLCEDSLEATDFYVVRISGRKAQRLDQDRKKVVPVRIWGCVRPLALFRSVLIEPS